MHLDAEQCYQAIISRDRRFDGRFFTGVVTTGVYCRPVCPVRPPKRENMRFFACAAAAQDAGFRPCLRCRPERSAGTPAWPDVPEVVSRAMQLISDGALDSSDVDAVAGRVGVGGRQLRRLFENHLGASPLSIAKARRVHFARKLLDETDLPISQIAFAAGFQSIRQFNHDIRATWARTPTELRRLRGRHLAPDGAGLVVRLPFRPPLDWEAMAAFLGARAIRGVEEVSGGCYRRTVEIGGAAGTIELCPAPSGEAHLLLRVRLPSTEGLIGVVERARRIFDLGADPLTITGRLGADPLLAGAVRARPGLRVPGAWDGFEVAVRAVLGQQISVRAATALAGRLVSTYGKPFEGLDSPALTHLFPSPETLSDADLTQIGATRAQAGAIRAVARAVASGDLTLDPSLGLGEFSERMCALPGVGPWTAHYVAMRLGEPDAFPSSDLGLRRAAASDGEDAPPARELARRAEAWRPWRSYAAVYLWHKNSGPKARTTTRKER